MSDKKSKRIKVVLGGGEKGKLVRLSYLHAHEPRMNEQSKKLEYSVAVLIPKANDVDIKNVKDAIEALKKDTWLDEKKPLPPGLWSPLRDGDKDTKQDGTPLGAETRGHYVINAKTDAEHAPDVVGTARDGNNKPIKIGKADVKSGDWGRVSITLGAYTKGSGGVGAYLDNLQKVREGDSLGSKSSAEDDFSDFDDEDDDLLN